MNNFPAHGDLKGWVDFLSMGELPLLAFTQNSLSLLKLTDDTLVPADLATVALRDPLFATTVLRHIQEHKNKRRALDITTVEHAIMMMGIEPFYRAFGNAPTVEELLAGKAQSIEAIRRISKRSYVASRLAQDWAAKSMDIESEETQVAALIRDVAEMLLWIKAPGHAYSIKKMMLDDPTLRSAAAQRKFLGMPLVDVEIELCRKWGLPELLVQLLMGRSPSIRTSQVELAVKLARHSADGWKNPALPDDWDDAAELMSYDDAAAAEEDLRAKIEELLEKWEQLNAAPSHLP